MTGLTEDALAYIAEGLGQDTATQLHDFLRLGEGRFTAAKSHPESVRHALMLWSVRAKSTEITGVRIDGIKELVSSLRSLDPEAVLERYDVQDGRALLTLYRDMETKRPVGYQFVNTPEPSLVDLLHRDLGIVLTPSQKNFKQPVKLKKRISPSTTDKSPAKERLRRA